MNAMIPIRTQLRDAIIKNDYAIKRTFQIFMSAPTIGEFMKSKQPIN